MRRNQTVVHESPPTWRIITQNKQTNKTKQNRTQTHYQLIPVVNDSPGQLETLSESAPSQPAPT